MTGAVASFWWATRQGQFDDLETPAVRVLMDDQDEERNADT
ncbi:MAG: cbb3-type cytochrome oxidase assembly protein CcoS [Persicimonas sp.]